MPSTLLKTSLRHLLRHPWQFGLAVLGVALGVAVVVSIDLANDSARRAFALSAEAVAGRATHQVVGGPSGLDEALYRQLRLDLGLRDSAPLVEGYAAVPEHPGLTLHILGVDPLAEGPFRAFGAGDGTNIPPAFFLEPGAALMSAETARAYGIDNGATLAIRIGGRVARARIVGLLEAENEAGRRALDGLLIVDIATAQEWLEKLGRLDRIDLILPEDEAGAAQLRAIQGILPQGASLETPARRSGAIQQMTAAFELNLTALSLLALVVGMFLIYNTITFSVVQRRGQIGTLRCLGVTRGQVFALVLGEALAVGVIGALLGLGLGILLGRGLVGLVTRTINDLYFAVTVRSVAIGVWPLLKGLALGLGATLAAAALPAAEATSTPPRTVLRRSSYEERARRLAPQAALAGLVLLAAGGALLLAPGKDIVLGFAALLLLTLGAAAATPLATLALMRAARPAMGAAFGLLGRMAARDVTAALSRTSVAVAALMIAVSVTIGVGLMVGSFRRTVVRWLDATITADVYVAAPGVASRVDQPLPTELAERLAHAPGVARARRYRSVTVDSQVGPLLLVALEVAPQDRAIFQWVGPEPPGVWQGFARGEVLIAEPLAYRHDLRVGDTLRVRTDRGAVGLRVAGVFYDYGSDQGVAMIALDRYRALWDDGRVSSLGLYAAPGVDVDQLVRELRQRAGSGQALDIHSNRALRAASLEIFDRTFAITRVLQLLATIVAFVGILAALMALQLERARELGVLRASGLTPGQLWGLVIGQTGLMGLAAGLLALPAGVMMAAVLVFVINRRSFGWTLLFQLDGALFAQALLVALAAALLAGLYPAWRMGRTPPALALREE
ncbi:MAG TPA: FtsX-like permease family protein [Roseiflexaceae bacterium]|nr:FtsX-like permease family protein [Roseiflexaceae bacterium]